MSRFGRVGGVVGLLFLAVLLVSPGASVVWTAGANTGCPGTTQYFGSLTLSQTCTISADTFWGNGTLVIAGSLNVNSGVRLTLLNMVVKFSPSSDLQYSFNVAGSLVMDYGGLQSNNAYHWYLTSSGTSARIDIEHANITGAGSGSTFGIVATGGGGNRLAYDVLSGVNLQILGPNHDFVGYCNISNFDDSSLNQDTVWVGANSTFEHNTMWNITEGQQSVLFTFQNWGNTRVFANQIYYHVNGNNAMGIEVRNMDTQPLYSGFPVVSETWNNFTILSQSGSSPNAIPIDNEYSLREYIANNSVYLTPGVGGVNNCLQAGGVQDSIYENNRCKGLSASDAFDYCIYQYINSNAGNLFQGNTCDHASYGGIFQTGGNTYRSNTFTNVTTAGIWICPNASCAGSSANTSNNAWYNNTFTFAAGGSLTRMSLSNALYNTFLGHGGAQWTDGVSVYPVYGDWLFFANAPITHLAFGDDPGGYRTLYMTAGGQSYWDREPLPTVTDNATLALDGTFDSHGSLSGGTVLYALQPQGTSRLELVGSGPGSVALKGFAPNYTYNVSLQDLSTGSYQNGTLATDGAGAGTLGFSLAGSLTPYALTVWGTFPTPPGDTTPPAQVTDLRAATAGPTYVVLQWTAPGNNGTVGQATQYDLRMSTVGPITSATFYQSTRIATPPPAPAGTIETLNVSGLQPQTEYWFALRTADAVPNWSPISDVADVTTPPTPASATAPSVSSVAVDLATSTVGVSFTAPMDRASVNASLAISPGLEYHVVWLNDTHLSIVLDAPLQNATTYTLTISRTARDQEGLSLSSPLSYQFSTPPSGPTETPPPPWTPWVLWAALAVGIVMAALAAGFYLRRFRKPPKTGN